MMNNKGPKISIIIPIYNVEDYVGKCLESVTNQTLKDIEVICVDDGTKDNSCAVVEAYMKEDDRIKLVHKENGGLSSARNYGLQYATGEYIWWIDSDDYIEKNGCESRKKEYFESNLKECISWWNANRTLYGNGWCTGFRHGENDGAGWKGICTCTGCSEFR